MQDTTRKHLRDFIVWFLLSLILMSVGLNAYLLAKLNGIDPWDRLLITFTSPPTLTAADHVLGPPSASVVVVDYADFQCPFSSRMYKSLKQLAEQAKIRFVYRHYPLAAIHPAAFTAAVASECAAGRGKFWEFADSIVNGNVDLSRVEDVGSQLSDVAERLGMDRQEFKSCLSSPNVQQRVRAQMVEGVAKRVHSTPTIFVNGHRSVGELSPTALTDLIGVQKEN